MRLNRLTLALLLLAVAVRSPAEPGGAPAVESVVVKAEKGDAGAQYNLGHMYDKGVNVEKDAVAAVKWYRKAAGQNNADAQYNLGNMYANGNGVEKDPAEAVRWYRQAAEQNNVDAQYNLGNMYYHGDGVEKDPAEAVRWYRQAADQNDAEAQYNLGSCYDNGTGVEKNYEEAVKWYRQAADQNIAVAQYNLGYCYNHGKGVEKDSEEAVKWYRLAAGQNYAKAQYNLGFCYAKGLGVEPDQAEAVKWYRQAAEQSDAKAQYVLGDCYYNGLGVGPDPVEAYKWNALAAAQGDADAVNRLRDVFQEKLTPEQISEGQSRVEAFNSGNVEQGGFSVPDARVVKPQTGGGGTGFFITDDGFLVTCAHVIQGATQIHLVTSAGKVSATVVRVDSLKDLALLKAGGRFKSLAVTMSQGVKPGGKVTTAGFPDIGSHRFAPKPAEGEIASLSGAADDVRYFRIRMPLQPGNSGGALLDERGNVVGVVSAGLDGAVKSSFLLSFLESVPDVANKLREPNTKEEKSEDVVKSAQDAAVLVLVN